MSQEPVLETPEINQYKPAVEKLLNTIQTLEKMLAKKLILKYNSIFNRPCDEDEEISSKNLLMTKGDIPGLTFSAITDKAGVTFQYFYLNTIGQTTPVELNHLTECPVSDTAYSLMNLIDNLNLELMNNSTPNRIGERQLPVSLSLQGMDKESLEKHVTGLFDNIKLTFQKIIETNQDVNLRHFQTPSRIVSLSDTDAMAWFEYTWGLGVVATLNIRNLLSDDQRRFNWANEVISFSSHGFESELPVFATYFENTQTWLTSVLDTHRKQRAERDASKQS